MSNDILLTNTINLFQFLFETMDNVFSGLCIISPVENEINDLQNAIKMLESVWRELDLNITPKAHILFVHAVEQVRRFGGIADLVEDFIEKAHQTGKQLDHLAARMCSQGFRQQELVKIRRQWLQSDPLVSRQVSKIRETQRRKFKNIPSGRNTKCNRIKKIKSLRANKYN